MAKTRTVSKPGKESKALAFAASKPAKKVGSIASVPPPPGTVRFTFNCPKDIHKQLKMLSIEQERPVSEILTEWIQEKLRK